MLIEAPYKIGDVVSLKLSSGEEILGRLESEDTNNYTLKKPMEDLLLLCSQCRPMVNLL